MHKYTESMYEISLSLVDQFKESMISLLLPCTAVKSVVNNSD